MTLDQFGARPVVGRLVSASMVKELGPVLTALMLAGRVGSGIAAELGSMVVTDQINALRALGTDPIRKLVVPRVIAGVLMAPILTVISDFVGILGGGVDRDVSSCRCRRACTGNRSSTGCTCRTCGWASSSRSSSASPSSASAATSGLRTKGGTQGVGRATTQRGRGGIGGGAGGGLLHHAAADHVVVLMHGSTMRKRSTGTHRRARSAADEATPVVVFDHVSLAFDDKVVLRDVSFTLLRGAHEDHPGRQRRREVDRS